MPMTMSRRLSDLLLRQGLLTNADLGRAIEEQQSTGEPLPQVLMRLEMLTAPELYRALADHLRLGYIDLPEHPIDPGAIGLIPEAMTRRYNMLPIGFTESGALLLAMSDPSNVLAVDDARNVSDREIQPVVATPDHIGDAIERYARMGDAVDDAFAGVAEDEDDLTSLTSAAQDAPVVKFVNSLIAQAVQDRASDLHFEPQEHDFRVRYRVDGVLHEVTRQRRSIHAGVVCGSRSWPASTSPSGASPRTVGRACGLAGSDIDLRVSSLPTVHGEKVVLRVLDKNSSLLNLKRAEPPPDNFGRYEASFRKPYGMVLVTGPTGSGKSTTLYATSNAINNPTVNTSRSRTPSSTRSPASARCPSTRGRASRSPGRCGPSSARTPTSSCSGRCATWRRPRSAPRRRSPATSCSPRSTPTTHPRR